MKDSRLSLRESSVWDSRLSLRESSVWESCLSLRESSVWESCLSLRESSVWESCLSLRESSVWVSWFLRYFRGAKGDYLRLSTTIFAQGGNDEPIVLGLRPLRGEFEYLANELRRGLRLCQCCELANQ
jgi:hypothetical protein